MKKVIALCLSLACFTGCTAVVTPGVSSVPVDSSEIAKSTLLGENCLSWVLGLGPFGSASIKEVLDKNADKKITLIDHKQGWYLFTSNYCVQVYGYPVSAKTVSLK